MKKTLLTFFLASTLLQLFSQTAQTKNTYLKLSGGRVVFGTGDFFGYSIAFDISKNVINKSRWGLDKLLLGGEFIFENGVKNPVVGTFVEKGFQYQQTQNCRPWAQPPCQ